MTVIEQHPELEAEQAYVRHAYDCMAVMLRTVERFGTHGRNDFEKQAFEYWREVRIASLSDTVSALVFGRLDDRAGERHYIGRRHVKEEDGATVVVDWRAPVSQAFYRAHAADPMNLRRRRQFLVEGPEVLGIADDEFDGRAAADPIRGREVLRAELARRRTGEMRDIVATIQAEQDLVIRSPLEGVVVVQGGPGTGKTAIGLHRASFLLYEHRQQLVRDGVLVVGPNPTFMRYIAQVLPSLGEFAVTQRTITELAPLVPATAIGEVAAERLKGDARMATVIARALAQHARGLEADVEFRVDGRRYVVERAAVEREVADLRARGVPHREAREVLRDRMLRALYQSYLARVADGSTPLGPSEVLPKLRAAREFRDALDRAWPAVGPEALVGGLLASTQRLARAAEDIFSPDEQRLLRRPRRAGWTTAERALLDEASALIDGAPDRYGHLVVDEAQDLSPMQLRMLARRCPAGSMTVLGDLGQATGPWAHRDWDEVLEHLPQPDRARREELTLGYRVTAPVMAVAAEVLREAAPALRPPVAVRADEGMVEFLPAAASEVPTAVARLARAMGERGTTAVVAPAAALEPLRASLNAVGVGFGEAERDGIGGSVTLVPATAAKGLEFDAVILVEPTQIAAEPAGGLRLLYVCITRAMRDLVVVHSEPLPDPLARAAAGPGLARAG